jgi:hypothetical protein
MLNKRINFITWDAYCFLSSSKRFGKEKTHPTRIIVYIPHDINNICTGIQGPIRLHPVLFNIIVENSSGVSETYNLEAAGSKLLPLLRL